MPTFRLTLVSPESLLFSDRVDQADLPGVEGDFGVLSGHAAIVAMLRPGIVTVMAGNTIRKFVALGGLAEFSGEELTILAESASPVEEFDLAEFHSMIEELQQSLEKQPVGTELDRAIALLDHYKSIRTSLAAATAF
ncbi:F0F1 ATP synthase subunit epsilon [Bradyrhizobium sp. JR3.5]